MSNLNQELPASVFVKVITNSTELDKKTKQFIMSKLLEVESNIEKNKNKKAFENWSNFIKKEVTKYVLYYHNYENIIPRYLEKIWNKVSYNRKQKWINLDYTDNYPYMLLLFDYSTSDCDIIYQSYKSYMEERDFYTQFRLVTAKLFMSLSLENEYLLSYIVDNIIFYMQRRVITMCKMSKEIRRKIIKIFMTYRENANEDSNLYFINLIKKLVYYDKCGGILSLNVHFNDKLQIKYIEK
jgi:hypothetical protein